MAQLLQDSIDKGIEIQVKATPAKAKATSDGPPRPSTWEYLIDTLTLAVNPDTGHGQFLPLTNIIAIMRERGWTTKAGTDGLAYRTVHSSTYKACKNHARGHVLGADCIDRSKAKDALYALAKGVDPKAIARHQEWVLGFLPKVDETEGTDEAENTEQALGTDETPETETPEQAPTTDTEQAPETPAPRVDPEQAPTTDTEQAPETPAPRKRGRARTRKAS